MNYQDDTRGTGKGRCLFQIQSIVSLHFIKTCRIVKQESFNRANSRVFHLRGSARVRRVVQAGLL